jgi:hypothetical protein
VLLFEASLLGLFEAFKQGLGQLVLKVQGYGGVHTREEQAAVAEKLLQSR